MNKGSNEVTESVIVRLCEWRGLSFKISSLLDRKIECVYIYNSVI